jgi:hypothetical protein
MKWSVLFDAHHAHTEHGADYPSLDCLGDAVGWTGPATRRRCRRRTRPETTRVDDARRHLQQVDAAQNRGPATPSSRRIPLSAEGVRSNRSEAYPAHSRAALWADAHCCHTYRTAWSSHFNSPSTTASRSSILLFMPRLRSRSESAAGESAALFTRPQRARGP